MILPFPSLDLRGKDPLAFSVAPCFPTSLMNQTAVMKTGQRMNLDTCPCPNPLFDHDIPIKAVAFSSPWCTVMLFWVLCLLPLSAPQGLQWRKNLTYGWESYPSKCQVSACSPNWNHPANTVPGVSLFKTWGLRGHQKTGSLEKQQPSDFWQMAPCGTEK